MPLLYVLYGLRWFALAPVNLVARLKEKWLAFSRTKKMFTALLTAGVVVLLFFLGQLVLRPAYAPLLTGLDPKDASVIIEELKAMNIPYQLTDQGKTIRVPEVQVYETRGQLASSGALGGAMGFELFNQDKIGRTDFELQVDYQRALQEELRRTIIQIEGVEQARVHLVIPQKNVIVNNNQVTPSASIALKLEPAAELKPEQLQGISDILVGSLEGLKPENIHIIDTEGNVLSDNLNLSDPMVVMTRTALDQQKAQREYEKELEKRVQQMLVQILGQNNAVAMVTADLDFNQKQITSTTSTNPQNLKASEQTVKENGSGNETWMAPGIDPKAAAVPIPLGGGTSSYYTEDYKIIYQVDTREETVVNVPGSIRRLSASVVVNESDGPVDTQKVKDVVAAAIGFKQDRGDQINVSSMIFDNTYQKKVENEMAQLETQAYADERFNTYVRIGSLASAAILVIILLTILWRHSAQRVDTIDRNDFVQLKDIEAGEFTVYRDDKQQKIRDMAKEKPEDIAELLKVWIRE
jgi:flagellar M-ring protein FliF